MVNNLTSNVTNLSDARSRIEDADYSTETTQMAIAEASAEIDMAHLLMHTRRREACAAVDAGGEISRQALLTIRRDVAFAQRHVRTGVERLCDALGSHLVYDDSPLQPLLRDVLTMADRGELTDMKTYSLVMSLDRHHPDLFQELT